MDGAVAGRPVFTVGGRTFAWADVLDAARRYRSWRELEAIARHGLACQKRLVVSGEQLAAEDLLRATTRFRYARNLLSGDELNEWLEHWELALPDLHGHAQRTVLRERWAGELGETAKRFPVCDDEVAGALWTEAVCTGFLERSTDRIAGDCALAVAAGAEVDAPAFDRIRAVAARARAEAVTKEAIERELALHRLEWLRIEGEILDVPGEDTAREAALCIRADGRSLADVATECGTQPSALGVYLEDVDDELSSALVAARECELIGPLRRDAGYALLLIERKTPPIAADPETRRRAEERIVEHAVQRAMLEHVEWHERL